MGRQACRAALVALAALMVASCHTGSVPPTATQDQAALSSAHAALKARARGVLVRALAEETGWIQVHAADALIAVGEGATAREVFSRGMPANESSVSRVGVWRTMAGTSASPEENQRWRTKIEAAFLTPGGADSPQAVETLGKLGYKLTGPAREAAIRLADTGTDLEKPLGLWPVALMGDRTAAPRLATLLGSSVPVVRLRAAYVLRWIGEKNPAVLATLASAADQEPRDSEAYPYILSAALWLQANPSRLKAWRALADEYVLTGTAGGRYELTQTLRAYCTVEDLPRYLPLLDFPEADPRIGAAWLVLDVLRKHEARGAKH